MCVCVCVRVRLSVCLCECVYLCTVTSIDMMCIFFVSSVIYIRCEHIGFASCSCDALDHAP